MAVPLHAPIPRRPATRGRPPLRVLPGGREAALRHRQPPAVYRRRRLAVGLAAATLLVVAMLSVGRLEAAVVGAGADGERAAAEAVAPVGAPAPVAGEVYVVQPGDTLWSIAARLRPDADPRPLVDELARAAGGPVLQPGQRIPLDALDG